MKLEKAEELIIPIRCDRSALLTIVANHQQVKYLIETSFLYIA
jgi:hypothetical protein